MTKEKKKIVVIIQARMGSTRLPGKVIKRICGKPMLWHIIERLKYCHLIDKIAVATSLNRKDDVIERFCYQYRVAFFRGNEEDVLDRYYQAAKKFGAQIIVRITADCPLIDPKIVDKVISFFLKKTNFVDYASNTLKRTYPRGLDVEVFSFDAFRKCWKKANKKYQREHVTPYLYENSSLFKLINIMNKKDLGSFRWTVDKEADLEFVQRVYNKLYQKKKVFFMKDVLKVIKDESELSRINKNIKQ